MNKKEKYKRSLSYWQMAFYYLLTTEAIFEKTIESNNKWIIIDNSPIEENTIHEKTKFSDFNVMVPALFNLYHGFELLLKGFILIKKEIGDNLNHKIEELFKDFKELYPDEKGIIGILEKYLIITQTIEPLKSFFTVNSISANKFYEALRYPVNKKSTVEYDHYELKYKDSEGIPFFKETRENLKNLRPMIVKLGRSFNE